MWDAVAVMRRGRVGFMVGFLEVEVRVRGSLGWEVDSNGILYIGVSTMMPALFSLS